MDIALYVGPYIGTPGGIRRGARVLVVEDEPAIGHCLDMIVRGLGCTSIGPVPALADALELARTAAIDAALLDVHLDGGDVAYPIALALQARGIPFAFITGHAADVLGGDFRRCAVVSKPFRLAQIRRCMQHLVPHTAADAPTPSL